MSVIISPPMYLQFFDPNNSGSPLIGGLLFTYAAGGSTKQATWTDSTQSVQNANPIVLDGNGACYVWLDPTKSYKFVLSPKNDTDPPASPLRTVDNITGAYNGPVDWLNVVYDQTVAEAAANVTPLNKQYDEGHALRYIDSSQHSFILGFNQASQNGTTVATGIQNCLNVTNGKRKYFPAGYYKTATALTITNNGLEIQCDEETNFFYDDTAASGSFFLTVGKSSGTTTGFKSSNLNINLLTATAGGIQIINCTGSYWEYTLVSGFQPVSNWNSRTNVGVKIVSNNSHDCFFNVFNYLYLPHCITGVLVPGGGVSTQQIFKGFFYFGDSNNGCTTAIAFDVQGAMDSRVYGGYIEDIGAAGFGFRLLQATVPGSTTGANFWQVHDVVFDTVTTAVLFDVSAIENKFTGCNLGGAAVTDNSNTNSGNEVHSGNEWDVTSISTADATLKTRYLALKHYTNAQSALMMIGALSNTSTSQIIYGGGIATRNATQQHSFYTAANNTTTTGTEVARVDNSTTAADTRLLLWDVNKGALSRVSVGANDSGGTGFKVLRVTN
jgi:hypothetical protein